MKTLYQIEFYGDAGWLPADDIMGEDPPRFETRADAEAYLVWAVANLQTWRGEALNRNDYRINSFDCHMDDFTDYIPAS